MQVRNVFVGGWEFIKNDGIDEKISEIAGGKIVLIPDASRSPQNQIDRAVKRYKMYHTKVILLEENSEKIPDGVKVVYLGGGQPEKLMKYFEKRPLLLQDIRDKVSRMETILCGSSTGAMIQFNNMLAKDSRGTGNTNLIPGLGLIKNNAVVIPHWNEPNDSSEWRDNFLKVHRDKLIITIDEYTALFYAESGSFVVGLGIVNIMSDGQIKNYKCGESIKDLSLYPHYKFK